MPRTKEMQAFVDGFTQEVFNRKHSQCDVCVTCGNEDVKLRDFRNGISWKEYQISKMCQKCQDSVFGVD